jgi:hypothetical protein
MKSACPKTYVEQKYFIYLFLKIFLRGIFLCVSNYNLQETKKLSDTSTIDTTRNAAFKDVSNGFSVGAGRATTDANGNMTTALGHVPTPGHRHVADVWGSKQPALPVYLERIQKDHETYFDAKMPLAGLAVTDELRVQGTATIDGGDRHGEIITLDGKLTPTGTNHLLARAFPTVPDKEDSEDSGGGYFAEQNVRITANSAKWMIDHEETPTLARFIRTGIGEVVADVKIKKDGTPRQEKGIMLRNRTVNNETVTDAVLSEKYGCIDNDRVLEMLLDKFPKEHRDNLLASHAWYDGRNMSMNILVPDMCKERPDSEYGVGIAVKNSESGKYALSISAFLFRAICLNGCIWDKRESEVKVHKIHMGAIGFAALALDIEKVIQIGLSEGTLLLDQFDLSREIVVPNSLATIAYLGKANKLTTSQTRAWYEDFKKHEYEDTAFGVVNGLTQSAQRYQGETRANIEAHAARILTPSLQADIDAIGAKWERYTTRASEDWITDEKSMRQYVGVLA